MKKTKFTDAQIVFALRLADSSVKVEEVCRKMGISEATYYNWKKKITGDLRWSYSQICNLLLYIRCVADFVILPIITQQ